LTCQRRAGFPPLGLDGFTGLGSEGAGDNLDGKLGMLGGHGVECGDVRVRAEFALNRDLRCSFWIVRIAQADSLARNRINLAIGELRDNLSREPGNLPHEGFAAGMTTPMAEGIAGRHRGEAPMLWTITIVLFILWLLGVVSGYTLGSWIHILLVLAVIVLIFNLLSGRRAL